MSSLYEIFEVREDSVLPTPFTLEWMIKGKGFGQVYFYTDADDNVHIINEMLSKETIKDLLNKMVDTAILDDADDYKEPNDPNSFKLENHICCPVCNTPQKSVFLANEHIQPTPPKDGDVHMCSTCTSYLLYNSDLTLRIMSDDELLELDNDTLSLLTRYRNTLRRINSES